MRARSMATIAKEQKDMTRQRIPLVVVRETADGAYDVDLWMTSPPHAPDEVPLLTIRCAGFDSGKMDLDSDTLHSAPLTLWDSDGEKITTVYPALSAMSIRSGMRYVPLPYYDPKLQQAKDKR